MPLDSGGKITGREGVRTRRCGVEGLGGGERVGVGGWAGSVGSFSRRRRLETNQRCWEAPAQQRGRGHGEPRCDWVPRGPGESLPNNAKSNFDQAANSVSTLGGSIVFLFFFYPLTCRCIS